VLPEPQIRFDLMGTTAGTANAGLNLIRFSPVLLRENPNKFLIQTTGHEVGHIVTRKLHRGKEIDPHGDEWRNVMWAFGLRADTCHSYDTSNVPSQRGKRRVIAPQSPTIRNKDGTVSRFSKGVIITEL
jgi:SprT protein